MSETWRPEWPARCVACGLVTEDPDAYAVTEADGDAEGRPGHACPSTADGHHGWARARREGPMSDAPDIARLRELEARATPGPWVVGIPGDRHAVYVSRHQDDGVVVTTALTQDERVADLIAAMRNALPGLLDEVESLRRAVATIDRALGIVVPYLRDHDDGMSSGWMSTLAIAEHGLGIARDALGGDR